MSYDATLERIVAGIDEALDAAESRPGPWTYAFALFGRHLGAPVIETPQRPPSELPVFWLVTPTGEQVPFVGDMPTAITRGIPRVLLLQGAVYCTMRPWLPTGSLDPCRDLVLDLLVLPWGQTQNLQHRSVLSARVEAREVAPTAPLTFVVSSRPAGFPP